MSGSHINSVLAGFYQERQMAKIEMEVHGGMCRLEFQPGMSTGPSGSESSPGIGFMLKSESPALSGRDGLYYHGIGVIGRSDARRLRDALDEFFAANP